MTTQIPSVPWLPGPTLAQVRDMIQAHYLRVLMERDDWADVIHDHVGEESDED